MPALRFWWSHLQAPLAVFVVLATVFAVTPLDEHIARAVFFDAINARWVGGDAWVANELIHTGGRWASRALLAVVLAVWIATYVERDWRALRRPAAFFTISALLSIGVVGLLKTVTNVDCPWDLVPFGGRFPYVELFADRPDALRLGRCFPAAHASSGYALLALYFAFRERHATLAKLGLGSGTADRADVRLGAAGTRRALRLARRVERVPRLDDLALDLCIRLSRAAVAIGGT